eukprot:5240954-Amphidinium_carterae.2
MGRVRQTVGLRGSGSAGVRAVHRQSFSAFSSGESSSPCRLANQWVTSPKSFNVYPCHPFTLFCAMACSFANEMQERIKTGEDPSKAW